MTYCTVYIYSNEAVFRVSVPGNRDLGVMVAVPLHLQAERRGEDYILASKRQRNERRWEVGEGHPESIYLDV